MAISQESQSLGGCSRRNGKNCTKVDLESNFSIRLLVTYDLVAYTIAIFTGIRFFNDSVAKLLPSALSCEYNPVDMKLISFMNRRVNFILFFYATTVQFSRTMQFLCLPDARKCWFFALNSIIFRALFPHRTFVNELRTCEGACWEIIAKTTFEFWRITC